MEKYSKAVSEMYSQSIKREGHPLEKYIGRLAKYGGAKLEIVGYRRNKLAGEPMLIVDVPRWWGWSYLGPQDVVFKECKGYLYVSISDLIE